MSKSDTFKVTDLLTQYSTNLTDNVSFLENGSHKEIKDLLIKLKVHLTKSEKGEELDWHEAHKDGRKLWQILISQALNSIDPNSKGNSKLFKYLEDATNFEELLYGLEPYYRDHTLHSLWVYFLGDHLFRTDLAPIYEQPNWYVFNDIKRDQLDYDFSEELVNLSKEKKKNLCEEVNKHKDAIWCIIALCHDLGYSLSKLNNLNEQVQKVLEYFDISDFRHLGYSLDVEHQYHMSQFLELMAMDVRIVPGGDYKSEELRPHDRVLIKCYRDDSTYWRLSRALEKKEHGILSAYLIYKILGIFAESSMRGPAEEWGLDNNEAQKNIIRGDILFAIAQHEFDYAHLNQLGSFADVLIIADELEEFSRLGRQLKTRSYSHTTARSSIKFLSNDSGGKIELGKMINIEMDYYCEHNDFFDFLNFFVRKAEKLCNIYSLKPSLDDPKEENENYCIINSLKISVIWEKSKRKTKEKYWFRFSRDEDPVADLPKCNFPIKDWEPFLGEREYNLKSYDDELKVILQNDLKETKEIPLKRWIGERNNFNS